MHSFLFPLHPRRGSCFCFQRRDLSRYSLHTHTLINSALHHATFWRATIRSSESNFRAPESSSGWQQLFFLRYAHDYMWLSRISFFTFTWVAKPTKCMWKLWTLYSHITIAVLEMVSRPVIYLKHCVSETGFSSSGGSYSVELSFNLNTTRWVMSRIVIVILIYHRHKPIDSINLLGS
jgi:hypothetical protein